MVKEGVSRNVHKKKTKEDEIDSGSNKYAMLTEEEEEATLEEKDTKRDENHENKGIKNIENYLHDVREVPIEILNKEIQQFARREEISNKEEAEKEEGTQVECEKTEEGKEEIEKN